MLRRGEQTHMYLVVVARRGHIPILDQGVVKMPVEGVLHVDHVLDLLTNINTIIDSVIPIQTNAHSPPMPASQPCLRIG